MANLGSTDLKRLHREWRRRTDARLALALDDVQGPFNVGGIFRTASAYRADPLWLSANATGPENPKVGRTALGSERYFRLERLPTMTRILDSARAEGFRVVGVELAVGSVPIHEAPLRGDVCLVVGHEERGLSRAALDGCDTLAFIPQLGRTGSLNVSAATAIACYEWARQQWVT